MLVSSVGYIVGSSNNLENKNTQNTASNNSVRNEGSYKKDNNKMNLAYHTIFDSFKFAFNPEVRNAKRAIDMIA